MKEPTDSDAEMLQTLTKSQMYRDYELAFTVGTGLPLSLKLPEMLSLVRHTPKEENPFCKMMAGKKETCAQCYELQKRLETEAKLEPKTLKCFAGMCETAVPVRVGNKLIAFLKTGQVLLQRPDKKHFSRIAATLITWGAEVDLKRLEEAYFNTRVLTPKQYEALIRLLNIFAKHLAASSEKLALQAHPGESTAMTSARSYIKDHSDDELSLSAVSGVVNMSANYFSAKFKEATGLNFVDYVARTRIEKARHLLENPKLRISEIAFEVGFQSLSQFNRAFKSSVGEAPRVWREKFVTSNK